MLRLPDSWVWDFWIVDDGVRYHAFFLFASRALHDPEARHYRASIGHAVSDDLVSWTRVADALVRSDVPSWDDLATWTGSVVQGDDGTWFLFYTGATLTPAGNVQQIGVATSSDLMTWTKHPGSIVSPDPRWYELLSDEVWTDEAFRDPWVLRDPGGNGWHMLITARANHGEARERGVIGHASSDDLLTWTVHPPLTEPIHGFGQFEVPQYLEIDGQGLLIVNCGLSELAVWRRMRQPEGAIWVVPAQGPLGPYDFDEAYPLVDHELYVGKVVAVRGTGQHVLLAFRNLDPYGQFIGEIIDPLPVGLRDGRLVVLDDRTALSA